MEAGPESGQAWCPGDLEQVLRAHAAHFTALPTQFAAEYPNLDPYNRKCHQGRSGNFFFNQAELLF